MRHMLCQGMRGRRDAYAECAEGAEAGVGAIAGAGHGGGSGT